MFFLFLRELLYDYHPARLLDSLDFNNIFDTVDVSKVLEHIIPAGGMTFIPPVLVDESVCAKLDQTRFTELFEPFLGKTIFAIDTPKRSIQWCSPVRDNGIRSANETSASADTKWTEAFQFKMAVTSEDNMTTHAELDGITFLQPKVSGVFHDGVTADTDLKNSEAYLTFRKNYQNAIDALQPGDNVCIRIQLVGRQDAISELKTEQSGPQADRTGCTIMEKMKDLAI